MQPHTIKVTIDKGGVITTEVSGIQGEGCDALTAWLTQLGNVDEDRATPDYYELNADVLKDVGW